jgi:hypothetical protein
MLSIMRFTPTDGSYGRTQARRVICAAAFGSLTGSSSWAFVALPPRPPVPPPLAVRCSLKHPKAVQPMPFQFRQSRPLSSQKDDSDWEAFKKAGGNLVRRGVNKVRSFLPFLKSEDEKRAEIIKRERKGEITGGINEMLRDMPLPVRMLGRIVSPLLARAAEEMAEQSRQAEDLVEEARVRLVNDPVVVERLGEPVRVGQPFSQSSSTISINGRTTATVQASFPVAGPRGDGIATMESSNGEIRSLTVNVNGSSISVGSRRGGGAYGKSSKTDGNIIEAEIIEKK